MAPLIIDLYWEVFPKNDNLFCHIKVDADGKFDLTIKWDSYPYGFFHWELILNNIDPIGVTILYLQLGRYYCRYWSWGDIADEYKAYWEDWHPMLNRSSEDSFWPMWCYTKWLSACVFTLGMREQKFAAADNLMKFYQSHFDWIKDAYRRE